MLDNFEHLLEAAPLIAQLLQATPALRLLVTSREVLHVYGEHAFPVPPLALPDADRLPNLASLSQYEAVRLFIERAQAVQPSFQVTNENAPAVAEICHRLDGLPLAIELAAARIRLLSPQALLARLEKRLPLLTGGARDLPARQQTLRSTIDWSYNLLPPAEQTLFRRLAVFVGARTLEAVEAVCSVEGDPSTNSGQALPIDVLDGLQSLLDKNLLYQKTPVDGEPSFSMLETIWEYALERLEASGEAETLRQRHASYYLRLVEQAEPHLWGGDQEQWLTRLEQEHNNLRAALTWFMAQDDGAEPALCMAGYLWRFWDMRGHWTEGQQWLEQALARRASVAPARTWISLHGAGNLALNLGDYARAKAHYEESLVVTRQLGMQRGIANSLLNLSIAVLYQGDVRHAIALQEEALAIHREQSNNIGIALALHNLASMLEQQGDYDRAAFLAEESLVRYRELRDSRGVAFALHDLALVAHHRGSYDHARKLLEECRTIYYKLGDRDNLASVLNDLGELVYDQGEYGWAKALYEESLRLADDLGDRRRQAAALNNLGLLAHHTGDEEHAHILCSKSLALWRELGDKRGIAYVLLRMGEAAHLQGDDTNAIDLYTESLTLYHELGDRKRVAMCLDGLAGVAGGQRHWGRAARLYGAAAGLRSAIGASLPAADHTLYERQIATIQVGLGAQAFALRWEEGRGMTLDEAVAYARGEG